MLLKSDSVDASILVARAQIADRRFSETVDTLKPLSQAESATAELFEVLAEAYAGAGNQADALRAKSQADRLRKSNLKPE